MRLGRRASLLLALSLLTSAATAHAEGAWLLWSDFSLASDAGPKLDVSDGIESEPIPLGSEGLPYGGYLRRVLRMIEAWGRRRYPCVRDEIGRCEYKSTKVTVVCARVRERS